VVERITGSSRDTVINAASERLGHQPVLRWSSRNVLDWQGGPAIWAQWA
jgi:hypothetical protein